MRGEEDEVAGQGDEPGHGDEGGDEELDGGEGPEKQNVEDAAVEADASESGAGQTRETEAGAPERLGRVLRQQGTNPEAPPRKTSKTNPRADGIDDAEEGARAQPRRHLEPGRAQAPG